MRRSCQEQNLHKQICMSTTAHEYQVFVGNLIYQKPIRLNMAFPKIAPNAGKFVRTKTHRESFRVREYTNHVIQLVLIPAPLFHSFDILAKRSTVENTTHI